MARQSNNHVMRGTRGMFGKQVVFRVRKGKQVLAAPPNVKENRKPTPNQKSAQDRFKFSCDYANHAILNEDLKAAYQKVANKRQSAQNMAHRDAYNPPEVRSIVSKGYTGAVGNIIVVHAVDDFKVTRVHVAIFNANNELIEKGEASTDNHGVVWVYTASITNDVVAGCIIKATAFDLPENESLMEVVL
jgi:hypothetical protein